MYTIPKLLGKVYFTFVREKTIIQNPKKILIIRSGGIGDVLMSTPLVKTIKHHYPDAKITYFVGNWSKEVLKDNPDIDRIFNYDDLIIIKMRILKIFKLIKEIRKQRFDLCFNLEKSWHWSLLSYLFKIPVRIGFDRKGEGFGHTLKVPFDGSKYELEYYLDLARLINIRPTTDQMEIYTTKQENKTAQEFINKNNLKNKTLIGIAPGGADNPAQQAFVKRWPVENYIRLIDRLTHEKNNIQILLFGGNNDIETCKQIKNTIKNKDKITIATGKLTIKESAALIDQCKLFITHDSGPMHIAAAAKTNLIALFSSTPSKRFAPKNAEVIEVKDKECPCYNIYGRFEKHADICSKRIDFEEVYSKTKKHIKK